jgi:competence protein ComEC
MLDVGHGQCAAFRAPDGRVVLIDAGSRSVADPFEQVLEPFLQQRRWPAPVAAFISHGDSDHYNCLGGLLDWHAPRALFVNERFGREENLEPMLKRLVRHLEWHDVEMRRLSRGQCVELGKGCRLVALWPPASKAYDGLTHNDSCLVLRLECGGTRVLLPGDLQRPGQQLLLELSPADLRADVLVLPHHGSAVATLDSFIAAVAPKIILRSSGRRRDGTPEENKALITHDRFFSTDWGGAIRVDFAPDGPAVETHLSR